MRLNIVLPTKLSKFARCLEEICEALVYGARDLGHEAESSEDVKPLRTNVVLCPYLYVDRGIPLPEGTILYNLEQVSEGSSFFQPRHLEMMKSYEIWDYDVANIRKLKDWGIGALHCPVGGHPFLFRMTQHIDEDIDVVFAGALNERRSRVLDAIRKEGLRVEVLQHVYGDARDQIYARSKVCLNVHYYETMIFEAARVSYLLQNRRCVLTERSLGGGDEPFAKAMKTTYYEDLARAAKELASSADLRETLKKKTLEVMSRQSMTDSLLPLLGKAKEPPKKPDVETLLGPEMAASRRTLLASEDALRSAGHAIDQAPRDAPLIAMYDGNEHWREMLREGREKIPVYAPSFLLSDIAGTFDLVVSTGTTPVHMIKPHLRPGTTWFALGTDRASFFEAVLAHAPEGSAVYPQGSVTIVRAPGGEHRRSIGKPLPRRPKPWTEADLAAEKPPFPEAARLFPWALADRYQDGDRGPLLERILEETKGARLVADLGTGRGRTLRALLLAKPRHALVCDMHDVPDLPAMQEAAPWCHLELVPGDLRTRAALPASIDVMIIDTRLQCDDIYQVLDRHAGSAKKVLILGTRKYALTGEGGTGYGVWHAVSGFCSNKKWRVLFQDTAGIGMTAISR